MYPYISTQKKRKGSTLFVQFVLFIQGLDFCLRLHGSAFCQELWVGQNPKVPPEGQTRQAAGMDITLRRTSLMMESVFWEILQLCFLSQKIETLYALHMQRHRVY